MDSTNKMKKNIIFYDGYCVVCSRFIRFLISIDKKKRYSFANISSKISDKILRDRIKEEDIGKFIVLYSGDKIHKKSDAVIKIFTGFGGLFRIFNVLLIFPRILRDLFYDLFANYRYRLFGKYDKCHVPSKEIVDRFIYD
tara:strand:+ start:1200 stop:1619 length:420 start_codon:yes stop_codon:yes gene_type:complete